MLLILMNLGHGWFWSKIENWSNNSYIAYSKLIRFMLNSIITRKKSSREKKTEVLKNVDLLLKGQK